MAHAVHVLVVMWVRTFSPDQLSLSWRRKLAISPVLLEIDFGVPVSTDFQYFLALVVVNISFELVVLTFGEPASSCEVDLSVVACPQILNLHFLPDVNVHGADNEIVRAKHWQIKFISLVNPLQVGFISLNFLKVNVGFELLVELQHFASEVGVSFLVSPKHVLLPFTVTSGHRWMVRNLFRQVGEVFGDVFVGFAEQRIKWLSRSPFTDGESSNLMNRGQCQANERVHLLGRSVQKWVVLHGLGTLLQKRGRVVEVNWHANLGYVLADVVLDDRPYAHFHVWVLQPRQCRSLSRLSLTRN